jgi:large subunit ribosomal protein L15
MEGFDIRAPKGQRKNKRLGRGVGSGHGKTAGKGNKGQKARAGGGVRLGFEGGQMPLFRRIARRGFSNYPFKKEFQVVNITDLNRFADGETVTPASLAALGLARKKGVPVKILGNGEITKKLVIDGVRVSAAARDRIAAAGGEVKESPAPTGREPRVSAREKSRASAGSKSHARAEEKSHARVGDDGVKAPAAKSAGSDGADEGT